MPETLRRERKREIEKEKEREREFRVPGQQNSWSLWRMNRLCRGGGGRKRKGGLREAREGPKEREDASRMLRNELGRE